MEEFAVVMNLEKRSDLIYDYQKLEFYKIDRLVHHHNFHSVSFEITPTAVFCTGSTGNIRTCIECEYM